MLPQQPHQRTSRIVAWIGAAIAIILVVNVNYGQAPPGPTGCNENCMVGYQIRVANSGSGGDPFLLGDDYVDPSTTYYDVRLNELPCLRRWRTTTGDSDDPQGNVISHPRILLQQPSCVDSCGMPQPNGITPVEQTSVSLCYWGSYGDQNGTVNCYHDPENEEELGECIAP